MAEEKGKPVLQEIATTGFGLDVTRGFIEPLLLQPHQFDSVLRARGGDPKIYEDVMRDDQVKSTFQQRRLALTSREWVVEPGGESARDKAAADFIEEAVGALRFDDLTDKMLWGLFWGWAVGECIWARDGRFVTLEDVRVRKQRRFRWDRDGRLRLLTLSRPEGEIMPPRKFWTFSTGADNDDEPYGLGLAHWLYWPVFFKRHDIKFWLIFCDKFGMPTPHGKYPAGTLEADQNKLLAAIAAIQTDSGIITPEGMTVDLIEAARSGTATYDQLYARMDAAISKIVLSQTMTTDDGSSRAQADVHMDVRQEVVKADGDLVMGSFNAGPVAWLTDWNFPGAAPPKVWRRIEDEPDLKPVAERDRMIYNMGYEPTPQYIENTYGEGWVPRKKEAPPALSPGQPAAAPGEDPRDEGEDEMAFAESELDAIDDLARQLDAVAGDAADALIGRFRAIVETSRSFAELNERLLALHADLDAGPLADVLRQALAVAGLSGRADAAG